MQANAWVSPHLPQRHCFSLSCSHLPPPKKLRTTNTQTVYTHTHTHTARLPRALLSVMLIRWRRWGGEGHAWIMTHSSASLSNCHCRTAFTWHAHTHAHTRRAKVTFASSQTLPSDTEAVHSLCSLSHTSSSLYISHPTCVAMGENIGLVNKPLRSDHDLFLTPSCLTFYFTWLRHLSSPCPGITRYYKCVSVKHAL